MNWRAPWYPERRQFTGLDDSTRPIPWNLTPKQEIALGARLLWKRMRLHAIDHKPFAVATIRLQTFY